MGATWAPRSASVHRMQRRLTTFPRRTWKKLPAQTLRNSSSQICISSTPIRAELDSLSRFFARTSCSYTRPANSSLLADASKDVRRVSVPPGTWHHARKKRLWRYSIGCVGNGSVHRQVLKNFGAEAHETEAFRCGTAARTACGGFVIAPARRRSRHKPLRPTRPGTQLVLVTGTIRHL